MIKKTVVSLTPLTLLCSPAYLVAKFESDSLKLVDGTIFSWDAVCTVKKYQHKIKHFLNELRAANNSTYKLLDLAVQEKNKLLTDAEKNLFAAIVEEFIEFSEAFLATLNPVKQGLAPLLKEFCEKRNRQNSMLLMWCTTEVGKERPVFHANIQTYRAICELCLDLLNFTDELLESCPKATQAYNNFIDRVTKLEPLIDALLVTDRITISRHGVLYHELVRYIAEHYGAGEQVTTEKTADLYHKYNVKKRL